MEPISLFSSHPPSRPQVFLFYNRIFSNYQMSPHSHHYIEFMCLESGSCRFQLQDGEHQLKAGQFICLDAGVPHGMVVEEPARILNVEFYFSSPKSDPLAEKILPLPPPKKAGYYILEDNTNISTLMKMIIGEVTGHRPQQQLAAELLIWQLLLELRRLAQDQEQLHGNRHVRKAMAYLDSHYYADFSIGQLAEKLNLNRSYLQRIFKKETGCTPAAYLLNLRLQRASALLARTDLPIAEISDYVGFSSQQYFTHVFRKHKGMTPRQYRLTKKVTKT